MPITKTLAQLRVAALRRAGIDSSGTSADLTPAVLDELINDALYEGWDVIVGKWLDYFTVARQLPLVSGQQAYPLPVDFLKLRAVWMADGDRYYRLQPVDLDAAHEYEGQTVGSKNRYRYRMMGRSLYILPTPSSAETVRLYIIPAQPELVNATDSVTFDVPIELKYILALVWRDILDRQNLDPTPAVSKAQQYEAKLRTAADSRDAGEPFYLNPRGPSSDDDFDDGVL